MSHRKLSILLLFAFLAVTSYAQDLQGHTCNHDSQDKPEVERQDIEEDWNPEGNDHSGRTLASYNNMRFYGYYGGLSSASTAMRNYLQYELYPPILDYYGAALKVKYPVTGLWKTTASSVCGMSTPSVLKSGVNADFILFVVIDTTSDYIASTYTCTMASGSSRPLSGRTVISTDFISPTTDVLNHEKNMVCMIHELTHALGFSTSMYGHFIGSNGRTLSGQLSSATLDGSTSKILNVEPLTSMLREHFGCSTLRGAYMENSGSSGTDGSHFERRIFGYEVMTSGMIYQEQVSKFTFGLLEGSGWYVPDYTYADGFWFGQGQGCSFVTGSCSANTFSEWCSSSNRACTNPGRGGGGCGSDARSDNCKFIHPTYNYDCDYNGGRNYARLPSAEVYGRGENSKCFGGTLSTSKSGGSSTSFCFNYNCATSGSSTTLTVKVGSKSVVCTKKGEQSVSGYGGYFNCPDPTTFCQTVGAKVCPRNCMGRGTCVDGVCKCNSGYKGTDCALNA